MQIAKVYVNELEARTIYAKKITKGLRGGRVSLEYAGGIWEGLTKNVAFTNGLETVGIFGAGLEVEIPPEVTETAGVEIRVGVCGVDGTGVVIPTVWASLGEVLEAVPSDFEEADKELTPSVTEQLLSLIGPMDELGTEAKDSLVAAINEVIKLAGGDIDPEVIAEALAEYLAANPIQETDPTVPAWAKQPTKPGYTAEEVGALEGKSVYYWNHNTGGANDVFEIVLNYSCGVVTAGAGNPPTGMTFPAFVIVGSADRWYKNFSVIDNGGKFYRCVADLRTLEATVTPIYPSAEDVGALPSDTVIPTVPTNVSAFTNDKGYQTEAEVNALINTALGVIENGTY